MPGCGLPRKQNEFGMLLTEGPVSLEDARQAAGLEQDAADVRQGAQSAPVRLLCSVVGMWGGCVL
jgi:hypothetical protein